MIKFRVVELNNGLFEAQIKTIWYEKWYPVRYPSSFVSLDDAIKRMNEVQDFRYATEYHKIRMGAIQ